MTEYIPPSGFNELIERLRKEWFEAHGVHVGSAYGLGPKHALPAEWLIYVYSDDQSLAKKFPTAIEGYAVQVMGIPRTYW